MVLTEYNYLWNILDISASKRSCLL